MIRILVLAFILTSCSVTPRPEARQVYYINNKGATLPVVVSGADTEEIVLFVHGGPGSSGLLYYYAEAWQNFRKRYRMVFYDQRGSGGGRGHITEDSITVDQHVDDLRVVVASVKTLYPNAKIYLFGHSYGGMIAAAFASVYQDQLSGVAFLSPALNVVDLSTRIPAHMIDTFIDPYLARTDISSESRSEWEEIRRFYTYNTPLQLDSFVQHNSFVNRADIIQGLNKFDAYFSAVLPQLISEPLLEPIIWNTQLQLILPILDKNRESARNLETDPTFTLSKITIPSLLILGVNDLVVPPPSSEQSFNTISSVVKTIHTYDRTSHNAFLEHPGRIVDDLSSFIRDNP